MEYCCAPSCRPTLLTWHRLSPYKGLVTWQQCLPPHRVVPVAATRGEPHVRASCNFFRTRSRMSRCIGAPSLLQGSTDYTGKHTSTARALRPHRSNYEGSNTGA